VPDGGLIESQRRANRRYDDVDQLYRMALIKLWQTHVRE
jgi:DNA-binding transcriptional MerR regulator